MTEKELKLYQAGFKVALNFLYHHQESQEKKDDFEQFMKAHIDVETVDKSIQISGDPGCGPGECLMGGRCVACGFQFAFDGSYLNNSASNPTSA